MLDWPIGDSLLEVEYCEIDEFGNETVIEREVTLLDEFGRPMVGK